MITETITSTLIYTYTTYQYQFPSGMDLVVEARYSFGEVIVAGLLLALLALTAVRFAYDVLMQFWWRRGSE